MEDNQQSSVLVQYIGRILIATITLGAPVWFFLTLFDMVHNISINSPTVVFERGAYYGLGAGIAMGALAGMMMLETWLRKTPSDRTIKIFTRIAIGGLALMFLLPFSAEYTTENHLLKKGYQYCDVPSSSWPIYKDVIYTIDEKTCLKLLEEEKKKYPSLYSNDDEPISRLH